MRKRRRRSLPVDPLPIAIDSLSHDGRGVGHIDNKIHFIDGALPGEQVEFVYTDSKRKFAEGRVTNVLKSVDARQTPPCEHALICGGCSLQHLKSDEQIAFKQSTLVEQFEHFGDVQPAEILAPIRGPTLGYRRKARLAVKYVPKKGGMLVGFREKRNSFVAQIDHCPVLDERVARYLPDLRSMLVTLDCRAQLPQIEVAAGDEDLGLVFRHLEALSPSDQAALKKFCEDRNIHCYLQPKGPSTVHKIYPESGADRLYYRLEEFGLKYAFHPLDFTQVNADINAQMVSAALAALELKSTDRVLDLFCGLGNFTLPIAQFAEHVIGVEGSQAMVERGYENAQANGLTNVEFHAADLSQDCSSADWARTKVNKILLDPPRSGAAELIQYLPSLAAKGTSAIDKLIYVSCNPATLARDAGLLKSLGFRLQRAGIMDMFPHTSHVESLAIFSR